MARQNKTIQTLDIKQGKKSLYKNIGCGNEGVHYREDPKCCSDVSTWLFPGAPSSSFLLMSDIFLFSPEQLHTYNVTDTFL